MDSVKELLSDPNKGLYRAQGALCYLFRHVLLWRNVTQFRWNRLQTLYFEKPHNAKNADRGNLNKALIQDDLTWGSFKKAVDFLNPISAMLTVKLHWRSGSTSSYTIVIDPAEDESDPELNSFDDSEIFDKKKRTASTLARLFRQIVREENFTLERWNACFEEYVRDPINGIEQTPTALKNACASLQRDVTAPRMSWNIFRRGLLVLAPVKEEYILHMRWSNDPNVEGAEDDHSVMIVDPRAARLFMDPKNDKVD